MSLPPRSHAPAGLRIALIPAMFDPRLSYQENVMGETLVRLGHRVEVFTHGAVNTDRPVTEECDRQCPFPIHRAKRVLRFGGTKLPLDRTLVRRLREFDPQVALLLAPLQGPGWMLMRKLPAACRVISSYSDIPLHREKGGWQNVIKKWWARQVFRRSAIVLSVTEQTTALLREWGGSLLEGKLQTFGLLLDLQRLARPELPAAVAALQTRVGVFGAMVTRVKPEKNLVGFFGRISEFLAAHPESGFVLGGLDDNEASGDLRAAVAASPHADRIVLLPLLSLSEIAGVFSRAAFTVWTEASIGLYHSLHCGCPIVLWSGKGSAEHLLQDGVNGYWMRTLEEGAPVMSRALSHSWDRSAVAATVAAYDADKAMPRLLDDLWNCP